MVNPLRDSRRVTGSAGGFFSFSLLLHKSHLPIQLNLTLAQFTSNVRGKKRADVWIGATSKRSRRREREMGIRNSHRSALARVLGLLYRICGELPQPSPIQSKTGEPELSPDSSFPLSIMLHRKRSCLRGRGRGERKGRA